MARNTVLTRVAVGALAAALTLTACSDDGSGDGSDDAGR